MRESGRGDLYARFERLKAKLAAEGLFDPARKRPIPLLPRTIGIATSETGAAIRDMIRVARRRDPTSAYSSRRAPCRGRPPRRRSCAPSGGLNENGESDVLLVGRGGGSIEDLWAFNEEAVARAIAESRIPVISCVGHEIDFTIADFAADLRAPTPSAAAELAVPVLSELTASLDGARRRLRGALGRGQEARRAEFRRLLASAALAQPARAILEGRAGRLEQASARLGAAMGRRAERDRHRLEMAAGMLRSLDPANVVARGYAIVERAGRILTRAADASAGDEIGLRLSDGTIRATATEVRVKEHGEEKTDV